MRIRLVVGALLASACLAAPVMVSTEAAPALVLAEVYRNSIDPAAYWVSEKLDGVRAYWDGKQLYFRSGHPVPAPAWFTRDFPATPLDGELWLGRGTFERLSGIVRKTEPVDAEWRQVRYMLFELPGAGGTFSVRKDRLARLVEQAGIPWLQAVEQFRVDDRKALQAKLDGVVAAGGEGLMLHRADAQYSAGRSDDLVKLKPFLDREARVVAHLPGEGRNTGRLGALLVEDENGRQFRIGTGFSDAQRENPPTVGSLVTYRYRGLTAKGLPRFPAFLRIREAF
ncbi:MAG: DNA ligase [Parasulfuritortus sp.]|nr:DNA ligase [Parasulfuritortus sp.]